MPPTLDQQIGFIKDAREILEEDKKVEIVIDADNAHILKAIEESLGELKLSE